jgi:hypothetical protein
MIDMEDSISRLQGWRCAERAWSGSGREGIEGCVKHTSNGHPDRTQ